MQGQRANLRQIDIYIYIYSIYTYYILQSPTLGLQLCLTVARGIERFEQEQALSLHVEKTSLI